MTKSELRIKYKILRGQLDGDTIRNKSISIANNALKLDIWDEEYYHLFLSIEEKKEVDTEPLLSILSGKDKHIVISKSDFELKTMKNYLLMDNTKLKINNYNIPEPIDGIEIKNENIDVVFVPLLAFDTNGNRVGYGQGFYDRFLSQCREDVVKIGLSFFNAEDRISDAIDQDVRLDYCLTSQTIYDF